MGWRDLLERGDEEIVAPWSFGAWRGKSVRLGPRQWKIGGQWPDGDGWHRFRVSGRSATWIGRADPAPDVLQFVVTGYLVGDRLVPDDSDVDPNPADIVGKSERVMLLDDGVERFSRISAGRTTHDGPLVYRGLEMPLGPEQEVLEAYLGRLADVSPVKGVTPALDAAFRMETWHRVTVELRRAELERVRREEEARAEAEARRGELVRRLGDAKGRREMARVDFPEAARAALAVGGAEYLDSRVAPGGRGEMAVTFNFIRRRFVCTCDRFTLRVVDSGICLTAHDDDPDFEGGTRGDELFTLESLPAVIQEASASGKLVMYRHLG